MKSSLKPDQSTKYGGLIGMAALICLVFMLAAAAEESVNKLSLPIPERLADAEEDEPVSLEDLEGLSYQELEDLRLPRKMLIDYLIEEGKIRESPKGTIDYLDHLNDTGRQAVKDENRTRMQMFTLIAKREKRAFASIGREFHQQLTAKSKAAPKSGDPLPEVEPSLLVSAPVSISKSLLPKLVSGYLQSLGYGDVKTEITGGLSRMIGSRSFGTGFLAVDLETRMEGSKDEPKKDCVLFEAGGSSGSVPPNTIALEGLSIVVHPDNPVTTLTISQLADIFSGKISQWSKVSGGKEEGISVFLPGARPVLLDQFRELVLKPEKETLIKESSPEGQDNLGFLDFVASNPNAIAFCHLGELTDQVKTIKIKASSEAVPLSPSRINVKSLDYALVRYISLQPFGNSDSFMREFISYSQSDAGQETITEAGYVGIGIPLRQDVAEPGIHRQLLLDNSEIPDSYKSLIRNADRINSPANFRFVPRTDNFELTGYSELNFGQLVQYLKNPANRNQKVILIGFADSDGDSQANQIYSKKRADSIADKLRDKGIINIATEGMGEEMPIADNSNEDGRAANRRVEVWIER